MIKKSCLFIIIAVGLIGCASKNSTASSPVTKRLSLAVKAKIAARKGGAKKPAELTAERIAQFKSKVIRISIPNAGIKTLATNVATNGKYLNYRTKADRSYTFYGSELVATRGLTYDLMSRDIEPADRTFRFLNAENKIGTFDVTCEVTERVSEPLMFFGSQIDTIKTSETCKNPTKAFRVSQWKTPSGHLLKSQQWIGPQMGFMTIEWLN